MLLGAIVDVDKVLAAKKEKDFKNIVGLRELIESLRENGIEVVEGSALSAKEILEKIKKMRVSVEECIVISDSAKGVNEASKLGIPVIGFLTEDSEGWELSKADMLIEGFEEIDNIFVKRVYERAHHIPWIIAETPNCIIRESVLEDLEYFFEIYTGEGMEYVEPLADYKTEQEKLQAYIKNRYPFYEYGMWTVVDKQSGKVIGRAGIEEREINGEEKTEFGYMLHYLYRRRGIGTEICQAILAYAKSTLYMEEIHAYTHPKNLPSQKLLNKLGFWFCGEVNNGGTKLSCFYKKL